MSVPIPQSSQADGDSQTTHFRPIEYSVFFGVGLMVFAARRFSSVGFSFKKKLIKKKNLQIQILRKKQTPKTDFQTLFLVTNIQTNKNNSNVLTYTTNKNANDCENPARSSCGCSLSS